MNMQPMGNKVLVEIIQEKMREGIHIPEGYDDPRIGIVRGVGQGRRTKKGVVVPLAVSIGERVLMPNHSKTYVTLDDVRYWLIDSNEILGVLE